jgi:hypothetical protein
MELERRSQAGGDETRAKDGPEEIVFSDGNLESLYDVADAVGGAYELAVFENKVQLVLWRVGLCKGALDDVEEPAGVCEANEGVSVLEALEKEVDVGLALGCGGLGPFC